MKHNWEYMKLGDMCDIYQPKTVSAKDFDHGGRYFVYGSNGIIGRFNDFNHSESEVVMACRGTCGQINITKPYSWINGNAMVIHPKTDGLVKQYLGYHLRGIDVSKVITGTSIPQITRMSLSKVTIAIPPLLIQEQIVSELDKVSEIIEKKKQQVKELDNLAQSIFYDMFGDPVENEKGWQVKRLGEECFELRYGTSRPAVENGRYGYLRMGNLTTSGHLDLSDLKYIDIPENEIEKCLVKKGDVVFNRTNSLDLIGKTCMFDLENPMVIAGYIIRVRLKPSLHPRFVVSFFNTQTMKKVLRKTAKGAVNQANINSKELSSIRITLPPLDLQQSFAKKIEAIEKQKELINQSIKEVQTLFDARMNYYFGE